MELEAVQGSINELVPEQFAGLGVFPIILVATLVLGLLALYSYRIFRICLTVGGAIVFGVVGSSIIAPLVVSWLGDAIPAGIQMEYALGFIFALIGGVTMKFFFKVALFISGAGGGWMLGSTVCAIMRGFFPGVEFFNERVGIWVVSGVCAILLGVLSLFLFKFIYIVFTSLGGMVGAVVLIVISIKPDPGMPALTVAGVIGVIVGIIAAVNQYKNSGDVKHHRNDSDKEE